MPWDTTTPPLPAIEPPEPMIDSGFSIRRLASAHHNTN
jgi:hypothetical protein